MQTIKAKADYYRVQRLPIGLAIDFLNFYLIAVSDLFGTYRYEKK